MSTLTKRLDDKNSMMFVKANLKVNRHFEVNTFNFIWEILLIWKYDPILKHPKLCH